MPIYEKNYTWEKILKLSRNIRVSSDSRHYICSLLSSLLSIFLSSDREVDGRAVMLLLGAGAYDSELASL